MQYNDTTQSFELHDVWLSPGVTQLKFVVGGEWVLLSRQHVFHDRRGLVNNAVEVLRDGSVHYFEVSVL